MENLGLTANPVGYQSINHPLADLTKINLTLISC